jgi:N-methylhydantoinase B
MIVGMWGVDPRNGKPWFDLEPTVGGWGAWNGSDGQDGLINNVNGSLKDLPIEVLETKLPVRMTHYGFRPDSGGPGRWRGGNGVVREYTLDGDAELSLWFERSGTPAWGLFGGSAATPPDVVINPGREDERHLLKTSRLPLAAGDVVRTQTGGGGGFGDPRERDAAAVREDLLDRQITPEHAREAYGYDGGEA